MIADFRAGLRKSLMFASLTPKRLTIAILVVALAVRLSAAFCWQSQANHDGNTFRLGDSHSYWTLAGHIARFEPYEYGSSDAQVFRAPLFPILLAPLTRIASEPTNVMLARVLGCALGTLAVGLLMLGTARWFGVCASMGCGALAAIHPGAIGMSITILSETLFMPLAIAHLLCLACALRTENSIAKFSLLSGVAAGLAVLTRPSWILFIPFSAAIGLMTGLNKHNTQKQITIATLSLLAFCVTMSPWWIRNAFVVGKFVPSTLQVGLSLYDGLHPGASGASDEGMEFSRQFQEAQRVADHQASEDLAGTFEYRVDRRARQAAVEWATENPLEVLKLAWAKFLKTWSIWPDGGQNSSNALRIGVTLGTFSILILAVIGTFHLFRASKPNDSSNASSSTLSPQAWLLAILCWQPCLYFTAIHMVFVGSVRYREPGVFVLCALGGVGLACLAGCYKASHPVEVPLQLGQGSHPAQQGRN